MYSQSFLSIGWVESKQRQTNKQISKSQQACATAASYKYRASHDYGGRPGSGQSLTLLECFLKGSRHHLRFRMFMAQRAQLRKGTAPPVSLSSRGKSRECKRGQMTRSCWNLEFVVYSTRMALEVGLATNMRLQRNEKPGHDGTTLRLYEHFHSTSSSAFAGSKPNR